MCMALSLACVSLELKTSRPDGCLVVMVSIIQVKNYFAFCLSFQMVLFFCINSNSSSGNIFNSIFLGLVDEKKKLFRINFLAE